MKRSLVSVLAVVALTACFDDPTSGLRSGPDHLRVDRSFALVPSDDSIQIEAFVLDAQGNVLPVGAAQWTTDDPNLAAVNIAEDQIAGSASSRAFVRGVAASGGTTWARVNIDGVQDSVRLTIVPVAFVGGVVIANSALGPNTQLTLTAQANTSFNDDSEVSLGGTALTLLSVTPTTIVAIASANLTGPIVVTNVTLASLLLDELTTTADASISGSFFPGTVTNGAGAMLDTIVISSGASATFNTAAPISDVLVNGAAPFLLSRTANEIRVIARAGGTNPVVVTNVNVGAATISQLSTQTPLTISTTDQGEPGEVDNDNMLTTNDLPLTVAFDTVFGVLHTTDDGNDFYRVTLAAPGIIDVFLDFTGDGHTNPGNPDIDVYVVRDVNLSGTINGADICDEFGGSFVEADCTGATGAGPTEHEITQVLPAGTYYVNVELFLANGVSGPLFYRMRYRTP